MLIWTNTAISHITEIIKATKYEKEYINKLIEYTEILDNMPNVGKKIEFIISDYEIKQLIYKKHRIIYNVNAQNITILAVLHTRLDMKKALSKLVEM